MVDTRILVAVLILVVVVFIVVRRLLNKRQISYTELFTVTPDARIEHNSTSRYNYAFANRISSDVKPEKLTDGTVVAGVTIYGNSDSTELKPIHIVARRPDGSLLADRPISVDEQKAGSSFIWNEMSHIDAYPIAFTVRPETGDHSSSPKTNIRIKVNYLE